MIKNIIGFFNRKGGVGKTTSALNFAYGLTQYDKNVLLIDCDSQGNIATSLGVKHSLTLYHPLVVPDAISIQECIIEARDRLHVVSSDIRLAQAEQVLSAVRNYDALIHLLADLEGYDMIVLDSPPALDFLFYNAVCAANEAILPIKTDYLSVNGAREMLSVIEQVAEEHHEIAVAGLLPTFYDERRVLDREMLEIMNLHYPGLVLDPIHQNTDLAKAPAFHQTIFEYNSKSVGANDYDQLARRWA